MKIPSRPGKPAFTLIELMAVITIIVILAGLVVGGLGFVTERQAKEKARVQIALLSKAIEEYKLDMGQYPPTTNRSANITLPAGTRTSSILFDFLYWDSNRNNVGGFKPNGEPNDPEQRVYLSELDPKGRQGWTTGAASKNLIITDPWGNQYCYRSASNATGEPNANTQNPDFDLWSMGKDGKSNQNLTHKDNRDDIKNF